MNFEKYIGKKVRVETNIIDEYTNTKKVIDGVFDGSDNIGNTFYIIINGISYPEMCIENFGLLIEKPETKQLEYVEAYTIQVDPLDTINRKTDEIYKEEVEEEVYEVYKEKGWLSKSFWFDVGKVSAVLLIFLIIAITNSVITHTSVDEQTTTVTQPSYSTMYPNPQKSCLMIDNKLTCSQEVPIKDLEV